MKISTETIDYKPVIPSHPWATADRDVYTSGDLVPKGYERTFIDTGCVPVDDDGALIRMDMYTSIGPAGAMAHHRHLRHVRILRRGGRLHGRRRLRIGRRHRPIGLPRTRHRTGADAGRDHPWSGPRHHGRRGMSGHGRGRVLRHLGP